MPYCQSCDVAHLMEAVGDVAVCPVCGDREPWPRQPLFVVLGACATGKTTIFRPLAERLRGTCAVFDSDLLIDPLGPQIASTGWLVLMDAWLHVASAVAQSGVPTMVLGQLLTQNIDGLPGRRYVNDVHHVFLDCPDDEIRRRLSARPAWRRNDDNAKVDGQIGYAQWLRENVRDRVSTYGRSVNAVVDDIVDWFEATRRV